MSKVKRILSLVLAILMLLGTPVGEAFATPLSAAAIVGTGIEGDVTGDSLVNIMDVLRLAKYVAGWDVDVDESAIDTTGDGFINIMDVLRLAKYVAGWDVDVFYEDLSPSEGLAYTLSDDGSYYIVTGIGTCTDKALNIPAEHEGLPVKEIGRSAFYGNTDITKVIIPEGLEIISEMAFLNCQNVGAIQLSDTVTTIRHNAFSGCVEITRISIPASVIEIDGNPFSASNLERVSVDPANPKYYSVDNCVIEDAADTLVIGSGKSIIPDDGSVTVIGEEAFWGMYKLSEVSIPDTVTTLESSAFFNCFITSIDIPAGVVSIDDLALASCSYVETVTVDPANTVYHSDSNCLIETASGVLVVGCKNSVIPTDGSVTSIGEYAFSMSQMTELDIPDIVTSIGDGAFMGATFLESLIIPDSVTSLGWAAFNECTGLEWLVIPTGITEIDDFTFAMDIGTPSLSTVYYRGTPEQWADVTIGFANDALLAADVCYYSSSQPYDKSYTYWHYVDGVPTPWEPIEVSEGLTYTLSDDGSYYIVTGIGTCTDKALNIPAEHEGLPVKEIGSGAFESVISINKVTIPGSVTKIGERAFYFAYNIKEVIISEGCTVIGDNAFNSCRQLERASLPDGLQHIGSMAFNNSGITEIFIPASVIEIGSCAFRYCSDLVSVTVDPASSTYYAENGCLIKYETDEVILGVGNAVIPADRGIKCIGPYAFYDNYDIYTLDIPDGVTTIGEYAFAHTRNVGSITIPESVTSIGAGAFYYDSYVATVTFKGTYAQWEAIEKGENWDDGLGTGVSGGKYELICLGGGSIDPDPEPEPDVPEGCSEGLRYSLNSSGESYKVTGIGTCTDLDIIIPPTYMGKPVVEISSDAFNDEDITSVTIPSSVVTVGNLAFESCKNLKSVSISYGTTYIAPNAFNLCDSLESITVDPANTTYYSANNCLVEKLTETLIVGASDGNIPEGVKIIGESAFMGRQGLTSLNFPESVTTIGYKSFFGCSGLTQITIPKSVKSIEQQAFGYCTYLSVITYPGTEAEWDAITKGSSWDVGLGNNVGGYTVVCLTVDEPEPPAAEDLAYELSSDGTYYTVVGIGGYTSDEVVIPSTYNNLPVKAIGQYAFAGTYITSVIIPDSVKTIGKGAFNGCICLETVVFPVSVNSMGTEVFKNTSPTLRIYYAGTPAQSSYYTSAMSTNTADISADIFYYSSTTPTNNSYSYWHYVDGKPEMRYPYSWIEENEWEAMWRLVEKDSSRRIINEIMVGLQNMETEIYINVGISNDEIKSFCQEVLPTLAPKYCYFNANGFRYGWSSAGGLMVVYPTYYVTTKTQANTMMRELDNKVNSVIAGISADASDYEKIEYIHDWIVKNSTPDINNYMSGDGRGPHSDNAYGCIVDGEPVCLGYSKALAYMLGKLDVDVSYELGFSGGTGHIWSKVKCDGKWYNIDSIWDDPCGGFQDDDPDYVDYGYYMVTDSIIEGSRNVTANKIFSDPICVANDRTWFVMNNAYAANSSFNAYRAVADQLNAAHSAGDTYLYGRVQFATSEDYENFLSNLSSVYNYLNFAVNGLSYICSADSLTVTVRATVSGGYYSLYASQGCESEYEIIEIDPPVRVGGALNLPSAVGER